MKKEELNSSTTGKVVEMNCWQQFLTCTSQLHATWAPTCILSQRNMSHPYIFTFFAFKLPENLPFLWGGCFAHFFFCCCCFWHDQTTFISIKLQGYLLHIMQLHFHFFPIFNVSSDWIRTISKRHLLARHYEWVSLNNLCLWVLSP